DRRGKGAGRGDRPAARVAGRGRCRPLVRASLEALAFVASPDRLPASSRRQPAPPRPPRSRRGGGGRAPPPARAPRALAVGAAAGRGDAVVPGAARPRLRRALALAIAGLRRPPGDEGARPRDRQGLARAGPELARGLERPAGEARRCGPGPGG